MEMRMGCAVYVMAAESTTEDISAQNLNYAVDGSCTEDILPTWCFNIWLNEIHPHRCLVHMSTADESCTVTLNVKVSFQNYRNHRK